MKKSLKLSLSVCMIVVSLAMLIFGVYAASQVTYSITGSIFYEATGVFATVDTNLYVSTQSVHSAESEINSNSALFETGNTQVSNTQKLFKSDNLSTFGQNNDATVVGQFENLAINYGPYSIANQGTESEEVTSYVYYIVMTVKNYGNQEIAFRLNVTLQETTANTYIFKSNNLNIDGKSTQEYTEKIFVVAFGIKDVAQDCSSDFTISVTINEDLIVPELYTFSGSTLTGTTEYFTGGDITIPSEYNGTIITSIGASAFSGQTNLTSVVIPSSITSIENYAFAGCTNLKSVDIKGSVAMGNSIFADNALDSVEIGGVLSGEGLSYIFQTCKVEILRIPQCNFSTEPDFLNYLMRTKSLCSSSGIFACSLINYLFIVDASYLSMETTAEQQIIEAKVNEIRLMNGSNTLKAGISYIGVAAIQENLELIDFLGREYPDRGPISLSGFIAFGAFN